MIITTTLPELTGTEKQIAWARDIRAGRIAEIEQDAFAGRVRRHIMVANREDWDEIDSLTAAAVESHLAHTEATYWIDRRSHIVDALIADAIAPEFMRRKNARDIVTLQQLEAMGQITDVQRKRLNVLLSRQ